MLETFKVMLKITMGITKPLKGYDRKLLLKAPGQPRFLQIGD